jgi:hypothetical protein
MEKGDVMKATLGGCVVLLLVLAGIPAQALEPLVLYDDFNAKRIDPAKWSGTEGFAAARNPNAEAVRVILGGALRVLLTTYGDMSASSDAQHGRFGLALANPGPVTAMAAKVTVFTAGAEQCPDNPETSRARAQLLGFFFNDGSSTGPNDRTGDMLAGMNKDLDRDGRSIVAFISRCPDAACTNSLTVASHTFDTAWSPGHPDTLQLQWDREGHQFRFAVNPGAPGEETAALSYAEPDALPPVLAFKAIRASHSAANCTEARKQVSIVATFDDVLINASAVP